MKKLKNTKAITLIALVITIVVLLILAGISISALTQTGLFKKTKQAEQKYENAQVEENITLASYENGINQIISTGSREESFSNNQYSLEEKAIGTWIDGKTIYSKVLDMGTNYSIEPKAIEIKKDIPDIDFPIKLNIYLIDKENNIKSYHPCCIWQRNGTWKINPVGNWDADSKRHIYFYVEYTKN